MRTGTNSAAYSYIANSPLVGQIYFTNGSTLRMTTSKTFDFLNRLTSISSVPSAASVVSFEYSYNAANQRTLRREADQSLWRFDYDPLGQPRAASVRHMKETGQNRGLTPFMGAIGPPSVGAVAQLVSSSRQATDRDLRLAALGAMGRIGPAAKEAIPRLREALNDQDPDIRSIAATSLSKVLPQSSREVAR